MSYPEGKTTCPYLSFYPLHIIVCEKKETLQEPCKWCIRRTRVRTYHATRLVSMPSYNFVPVQSAQDDPALAAAVAASLADNHPARSTYLPVGESNWALGASNAASFGVVQGGWGFRGFQSFYSDILQHPRMFGFQHCTIPTL